MMYLKKYSSEEINEFYSLLVEVLEEVGIRYSKIRLEFSKWDDGCCYVVYWNGFDGLDDKWLVVDRIVDGVVRRCKGDERMWDIYLDSHFKVEK